MGEWQLCIMTISVHSRVGPTGPTRLRSEGAVIISSWMIILKGMQPSNGANAGLNRALLSPWAHDSTHNLAALAEIQKLTSSAHIATSRSRALKLAPFQWLMDE
jgi:hypothetical protein